MDNTTAARCITLSEARERGAIGVEQAAHLLGIGRTAAYEAARLGTLPTVRMGRRLLVPVPHLLRILGDEPPDSRSDQPLTDRQPCT